MIRTNQVESIKYLKFLIDCKGQQNRDHSAGVEEGVLRKRTYFNLPGQLTRIPNVQSTTYKQFYLLTLDGTLKWLASIKGRWKYSLLAEVLAALCAIKKAESQQNSNISWYLLFLKCSRCWTPRLIVKMAFLQVLGIPCPICGLALNCSPFRVALTLPGCLIHLPT